MAIDSPQYAEFKKQMIAIWGSEAEAKAFVADPDRVTKALRDHIWSLGNQNVTTVPSHAVAPTKGAAPRNATLRNGGRVRPAPASAARSSAAAAAHASIVAPGSGGR